MEVYLADTFRQSFDRLDGQSQKAVKATTFDLQLNPSAPGLKFHRIEKSRDPNFWSVRANADVRIVVHKTRDSLLLAYVDHHDAAYAWAERRRIVNYRTSHQVRRMADRLLPPAVRDVDGLGDERDRTVSIFNGPAPEVARLASPDAEVAAVAAWLRAAMADGIATSEMAVFVRSRDQLACARAAVAAAGVAGLELSECHEAPDSRMSLGTMHLAKGLEFKAVAVMACDDDALPLRARVEAVADEVELDDEFETERHLFYVACTRARDRLLVSGVAPGSEFFADLETERSQGRAEGS